MIRFEVLGCPAPKGSNRAMLRGGRAVFVPGGSKVNAEKLKSWDVAVREAAIEAVGSIDAPPFVDKPLAVAMVFRLARPAGHWNKKTGALKSSAPLMPRCRPDSSKLLRATEDSLNGIVFDDDSRIVETLLRKEWASPGNEGATIIVDEWRS